jgi:8-hydroxy-5-deazaflavin:NADPH oxidoreductase
MRIGIIGAGRVGGTLAGLFVHAGHEIAIANSRKPETIAPLAGDLGGHCHAVLTDEAAGFGEVVVLALPFGHYRDLHAIAVAGKTVVDATNYVPERDGHLPLLDDGSTSSSELVQEWLREADVVKAFNAMRWDHLREFGHEGGAGLRYGVAVAGDSAPAKRTIFDLIEQLGYEPVDAGSLAEGGRKFQPGTEVFTADLWADDLRERISGTLA